MLYSWVERGTKSQVFCQRTQYNDPGRVQTQALTASLTLNVYGWFPLISGPKLRLPLRKSIITQPEVQNLYILHSCLSIFWWYLLCIFFFSFFNDLLFCLIPCSLGASLYCWLLQIIWRNPFGKLLGTFSKLFVMKVKWNLVWTGYFITWRFAKQKPSCCKSWPDMPKLNSCIRTILHYWTHERLRNSLVVNTGWSTFSSRSLLVWLWILLAILWLLIMWLMAFRCSIKTLTKHLLTSCVNFTLACFSVFQFLKVMSNIYIRKIMISISAHLQLITLSNNEE